MSVFLKPRTACCLDCTVTEPMFVLASLVVIPPWLLLPGKCRQCSQLRPNMQCGDAASQLLSWCVVATGGKIGGALNAERAGPTDADKIWEYACWVVPFFGSKSALLVTSSYAHFWSNCHLHCDCELLEYCLPPFFLFLSRKPQFLYRQLILFAGVGTAVVKSLHTRIHQIVTAVICLNPFHYFSDYNTLSYFK